MTENKGTMKSSTVGKSLVTAFATTTTTAFFIVLNNSILYCSVRPISLATIMVVTMLESQIQMKDISINQKMGSIPYIKLEKDVII